MYSIEKIPSFAPRSLKYGAFGRSLKQQLATVKVQLHQKPMSSQLISISRLLENGIVHSGNVHSNTVELIME